MSRSPQSPSARQRMLAAGRDLLLERNYRFSWQGLKAAEVARRAEVSRQAFYSNWGDRDDFIHELVGYLIEEYEARFEFVEALTEMALSETSIREIVLKLAPDEFERVGNDPLFPVQLGLWAQHRQDDRITRALKRLYGGFSARFGEAVQQLLEREKMKFRPPFKPEDLARAVIALAEGLALQRGVAPDEVRVELFASFLLALLPGFVVPAGDERSVYDYFGDSGLT